MNKYQVWIRDAHLAGHIHTDDTDTETDIHEHALTFAQDVWDKDVVSDDISVCEIHESYYSDIAYCTGDDSLILGM